jgi:Phosphotransferase enzyme family
VRAQTALAAASGAAVRLLTPSLLTSWARNDVWRCALASSNPGLPGSVIVKHFKGEPERGFDEWAALAFLTTEPIEPPSAPRFLAGDATARVFVIEDLGPGPSLEDLLREADAAPAEAGLVNVARLTGRLHASLMDAATEFDRRREALAPRATSPIVAAAAFLRNERGRIAAWLTAAGVSPAPDLTLSIETVSRAVEHPGPFATFTHGDMAPSNNHVTPTAVRLLDFEYAGVRHALYDALLWTLFCPFPAPLIERADAAYRAALAAGCLAARDDRTYLRARATVAACRTLNLLQWLPPSLLTADQLWAPSVSARQAVLWHLARFSALASDVAELAPLIETLADLAHVLGTRWPPTDPSLVWPAFRGRPS